MNTDEKNVNYTTIIEQVDKQILNSFIGKEGFFWNGGKESLKTFTALHVKVKSISVKGKKVTFSFDPMPTKGFFGPSPFYDFSTSLNELSIWEHGIKSKPEDFLFFILLMKPDVVKQIIDKTIFFRENNSSGENMGDFFSAIVIQILKKTEIYDFIENPMKLTELRQSNQKSFLRRLFEKFVMINL